ncbi:MAG: tRNA (adenosine(37)-N6)-dimethylallyltransferase MiaA [Phycisphaerales bacterium]
MFPRFPVIIGPTAGGKSALAVDVALSIASRGGNAEIVTADAYQVYRGMDIGTAKPTAHERRGVPHHLIDLVEPGDRFTLADWLEAAERTVGDLRARGVVPVVVGGTHLYIKAFLEGLFEGPAADAGLREVLAALGPVALRQELERVDPAAALRLHPNDLRRTIRAIEVFRLTGKSISDHQQQWDREGGVRDDCVVIGLDWSAEMLNPRINARAKEMMAAGLLEETRGLATRGALRAFEPPAVNQAREALGYRQLIDHLEGRGSLEEAVERIKIETRRFGKAQRTWIRRLRTTPGAVWIDPAAVSPSEWCGLVIEALGR